MGTCVGEQVVQIIDTMEEEEEDMSRQPKQTVLTTDYKSNSTLYMITDILVITKLVKNTRCGNHDRIKRGDLVTLDTSAHLYSAQLRGEREPGIPGLGNMLLITPPQC